MRSMVGVGVAVGLVALVSCSKDDTGLECGQGTVERDGKCIVLECGTGTVEKDGQCVKATAKAVAAVFASTVDEACACKDAACFDAVEARMSKLLADHMDTLSFDSPEDKALSDRYTECRKSIKGDSGAEAIADMQTLVDKACECKDAACVEEVAKEWTEMGETWAEKASSGEVDAETARKMAGLGQRFSRCAQAALAMTTGSPTGTEPLGNASAEAASDLKIGVPECDKLIAQYVNCDKLPEQSRQAFREGAKAWKKSIEAGGDAARNALAASCKEAAAGADQAMRAVGCAP